MPARNGAKAVTANTAVDAFDVLFQRFRKEILNKVTRNDLSSNSDILRSIFNKVTDVISASRTEYKAERTEKGLNLVEFKMGVRIVFQNVVPPFKLEECSALFVYFDVDRDGRIGAEEFIVGVKGKLNFYRSALVDFVFQLLDKNCDGVICEKDMMSYLSKAGTPGILQGKMLTPKKKARQLIMKIGNTDREGAITLKDLQNFYIDRGLFTVDDVMFKYDMLDDWLLSDELATEYLRSVAPTFEAEGAVVRGEEQRRASEVLRRRGGVAVPNPAPADDTADVDQPAAGAGGAGAAGAVQSPPLQPVPPSTSSPSKPASVRQMMVVTTPGTATSSSGTSEAMSVLEQQKTQLMQQMEIMRQLQMAAQGGGAEGAAPPAAADPAPAAAESEPSPEKPSPPPMRTQSSRIMSSEQVKELVDTVKLLTKQLEEQNLVLKQKETQLADMAKNMQDQSNIIRSQQQMISTQQAVITTLTSNAVTI
jgi:Ca2+-binding EF-hand superfamily protein